MSVHNYPTNDFTAPANTVLDVPDHVGQVASTLAWELVDRDLSNIGWLDVLDARSITARTDGSIPRRLDGVAIADTEARHVDMSADLLRPWWVVEDGTRHPLGVFLFTAPVYHQRRAPTGFRQSKNTAITVTMVDQGHIVDQDSLFPFGMPPNGSIGEAESQILDELGIAPRNRLIDAAHTDMVSGPPNWQMGASWLKVLGELHTLAGWLPPHFDGMGRFVARTPPDLTTDPPKHRYLASRVSDLTVAPNSLDAPNTFQVIGTGPSHAPIYASATVDPSQPFSVESRDFRQVATTRVQGIASTEQAQRMADGLAAAASHGGATVSFTSPPDPRHDLFDTVEWEGVVYRETAWTLSLQAGGTMSHTLTLGGFGRNG